MPLSESSHGPVSGPRAAACASTQPRRMTVQRSVRIGLALVLFAATCVGVGLILTQSAEAHGTCANHQYRTYDGTHDEDGDGVGCESKPAPPEQSNSGSSTTGITSAGSHPAAHRTCAGHQYRTYDGTHDGDGDGVGCESKPAPPSRSGATSVGYDRDNWSFNSSGARARLGCSSSEHVDHIVALKEAYDSGGCRMVEHAQSRVRQRPRESVVPRSQRQSEQIRWRPRRVGRRLVRTAQAHRDRHAAGQAHLRIVDRWRGTARDHRRVGRSVHPVDGFAVRHNGVLVKRPPERRGIRASPATRQRLPVPRTAPTAKPSPTNPSGASARRRCASSPSPRT